MKSDNATSIKQIFQSMVPDQVGLLECVVVSADPLKLQAQNDDKLTLGSSNCTVPEHLTDHEEEITITEDYGWETEETSGGGGYGAYDSHAHSIKASKKKVMVHSGLKPDEHVMVMYVECGNQYYVLGRI